MSISYNAIMSVENFVPNGLTIGDLLSDTKSYVVPTHQRDYSWEKNHIETLWDDLTENKKEDSYFFGSVLFQTSSEDKRTITIIDGQQRLATLTVLLAVIRDSFYKPDIDDKEDAILTQQYIIRKITRDKKIKKIVLNSRNKKIFYHCIQSDPLGEEYKSFEDYKKEFGNLTTTNKLLEKAYNFFKNNIEKELKNKDNLEKKIAYLNDLSEQIREQLVIISITVSTIEDAYMIFETINERALELQVSDLFKNYLISKSKDKAVMDETWIRIFDTLDNRIRDFLKHYWHSKKGVIQKRKLFRELKKYIDDDKIDVDKLTREIEGEANIYSSLQNPDKWDDIKLRELITEFNILGVKQPLPLLMVGRLNLGEDEFKKLLKLINNFTFRYNIICNFPPNVLEQTYSNVAIKIRERKIKNTAKVLESLKDLKNNYPSNEEFERHFKGKTLKEAPKSRYILKKIDLNKFRKVDKRKESTEPFHYDKFTLEHILPKNINDEWKDYFRKNSISLRDVKDWVDRLGNLTLLDEPKNNFAKNEFITKKCEKAYNISRLKINESLKRLDGWNKTSIEQRENDFFNEAVEIWKIE